MGTPKTGNSVSEAVMPGRCAAPPAPAMMILNPAALAPLAKANSRSGVRCAETMCFSLVTPSALRVSAAWRMVSQSDWLPMMMATGAGMWSILSGIQKHRPDYKIGPRFGKAWQGVRNGLSCLGEFRQASKGCHAEENQGERRGGRERPQKRRRGTQGWAAPGQIGPYAGVGAPAFGRARGRQNDHSPAQDPIGAGAQPYRGTAGSRGYRFPAGYSESARLRTRAPELDRLYQTLPCERRADRARCRSLEADQRCFRARRRRSGAEGDRDDAVAPGAIIRRDRA